MVTEQAHRNAMRYQMTVEPDYLKAELFNRQTAEETGEFLSAVADECIRRQLYRVLISVRSSKPIFTVDRYGLSLFIELAVKYYGKIAVLADSTEVRIAQEYVVMLARLRGANVRTFRDEAAAAEWLKSESR
ncbi:MAG: hypothetical protein HYY78_09445 [Betaproteobacteria bacterium]|nr:hypothetical protein [Betaproteobacteria bacterium]